MKDYLILAFASGHLHFHGSSRSPRFQAELKHGFPNTLGPFALVKCKLLSLWIDRVPWSTHLGWVWRFRECWWCDSVWEVLSGKVQALTWIHTILLFVVWQRPCNTLVSHKEYNCRHSYWYLATIRNHQVPINLQCWTRSNIYTDITWFHWRQQGQL